MELVRAEKSLVWVCWREAGLFQRDERTVTCLCCAALSILCKNAKAGEPVGGNFHFLYGSQLKGSPFCRETGAAQGNGELSSSCSTRSSGTFALRESWLLNFAVVSSLPKSSFLLIKFMICISCDVQGELRVWYSRTSVSWPCRSRAGQERCWSPRSVVWLGSCTGILSPALELSVSLGWGFVWEEKPDYLSTNVSHCMICQENELFVFV